MHFSDKMLLVFISAPPSHPDMITIFTRDKNRSHVKPVSETDSTLRKKTMMRVKGPLVFSKAFLVHFSLPKKRTVRSLAVKDCVGFVSGICGTP